MKLIELFASVLLISFLFYCRNCKAKITANFNYIKQLLTTKKYLKCDLSGADLREAELTDAKLDGAIQGADLRQVEMQWTDQSEDNGKSGFS